MARLKCIVLTPERTLLDAAADFVALPLYDGEIGIAPAHGAMIGRLGCGEMRVKQGDHVLRFFLEGGFVEVIHDTVSVLTNRAVPAAEIDAAVAQQQLSAARERPARTPELIELRDRAVAQARAQLRIARRTQ